MRRPCSRPLRPLRVTTGFDRQPQDAGESGGFTAWSRRRREAPSAADPSAPRCESAAGRQRALTWPCTCSLPRACGCGAIRTYRRGVSSSRRCQVCCRSRFRWSQPGGTLRPPPPALLERRAPRFPIRHPQRCGRLPCNDVRRLLGPYAQSSSPSIPRPRC